MFSRKATQPPHCGVSDRNPAETANEYKLPEGRIVDRHEVRREDAESHENYKRHKCNNSRRKHRLALPRLCFLLNCQFLSRCICQAREHRGHLLSPEPVVEQQGGHDLIREWIGESMAERYKRRGQSLQPDAHCQALQLRREDTSVRPG